MTTMEVTQKEKFLINFEGQDFSSEGKNFIKVREGAFDFLKNNDFPTTKDEQWKYTSVSDILAREFKPQSSININNIDQFKIPDLDAYRMVFINGFFAEKFSDTIDEEKGDTFLLNITKAKTKYAQFMEQYFGRLARPKYSSFNALNTAFSQDGGYLHIKDGVVLDKPLHLIFLTEGTDVTAQPRTLVALGKNAKADIISTYGSIDGDSSFTNAISEYALAAGSSLNVTKIQLENSSDYHISYDAVLQDKDTNFTLNTVPVSGKLIRNNVHVMVDGTNCETNLYGLNYLNNSEHVDNQTYIEHIKPHCTSNELYKSIVNDSATSIFNGKIKVHQKAQKTMAYQSNANIITNDGAKANAKPELEIYADDVKCSHGSTTGQFDEEAVFYLRARGIKESTARKILLDAFADEVIDKIEIEQVAAYVRTKLANKFNNISI